ncbi:MAG: hypothetical protein KVP17_002531 [Porospora cf. gigantea B]|uniref:uncharacterized protein n=2 Tax=Porospora cf. gigantea B TaxID=2853592 RepID=UPI003571C57C|nr:MAG: hypothetical protein KVP17_002531 [Porospora cf. gigantea B]
MHTFMWLAFLTAVALAKLPRLSRFESFDRPERLLQTEHDDLSAKGTQDLDDEGAHERERFTRFQQIIRDEIKPLREKIEALAVESEEAHQEGDPEPNKEQRFKQVGLPPADQDRLNELLAQSGLSPGVVEGIKDIQQIFERNQQDIAKLGSSWGAPSMTPDKMNGLMYSAMANHPTMDPKLYEKMFENWRYQLAKMYPPFMTPGVQGPPPSMTGTGAGFMAPAAGIPAPPPGFPGFQGAQAFSYKNGA